jgi:MFS family permease
VTVQQSSVGSWKQLRALPGATKRVLSIHLLNSVGSGLVLPFLAIYVARTRGAGAGAGSIALVTLAAGSLIANVVSGRAADRFGPKPVLQLGWLINAVGDVALVIAHSRGQLLGSTALVGVGAGLAYPAIRTLLASVTPPDQQPLTFSIEHALLNFGFSAGALVAAVIVAAGTIAQLQLVYLLDAATFITAAALTQVLVRTPVTIPEPETSPERTRPRSGYRQVLADRTFFRLCLIQGLLVTFGYVQFSAALPLWLSRPGGLSSRAVAVVVAINTIVVTVAALPVATITARRRRSTLVVAGAVTFAATWIILPVSGRATGLLAIAIAGSAAGVMAVGESFLAPAVGPLVNRLATDELRGRYNATDALTLSLGTVIGPTITAILINRPSVELFGVLTLGCLAAAAVTSSSTRLRAMG